VWQPSYPPITLFLLCCRVLSAVQQDQGRCWLISEFMSGGTLAQWLHADKGPLGPNKPLLQRAHRALDVS
jgi:hypothetical protein